MGRHSVWELVFLMVILKIPIVYLGTVVVYAIRAEPHPEEGAAVTVRLGSDDSGPGWRRGTAPLPAAPARRALADVLALTADRGRPRGGEPPVTDIGYENGGVPAFGDGRRLPRVARDLRQPHLARVAPAAADPPRDPHRV